MSNKKTGVYLFCLLILGLILTACGNDAPPPPVTTVAAATTQAADTTSAATNPPATPTAQPTIPATPTPTTATNAEPTPFPTLPPVQSFVPGRLDPSSATTTQAQVAGAKKLPRFEATEDCPFKLPEGKETTCGYVIVPESHAQPNNGRTLKLAVVVFKSTNPKPAPVPIINIEGGPGGQVQGAISALTGDYYKAFTGNTDAIFYDQRGVGKSEPALFCPEFYTDLPVPPAQPFGDPEKLDDELRAALYCHDRFVNQGYNLNAYNSSESAGDINDIRIALGYSQLNLYGSSYGTLLAQTVMRLYPQIVRSVVLDSVVRPDINFDLNSVATGSRSFNLIFQTCAADAACNKAYPDLKNVFSKTIAKLDSKQASVPVTDPYYGDKFDVKISGTELVQLLFQLMYSSRALPKIPQLIYSISKADYSLLGSIISSSLYGDDIDWGMYFSVVCSEVWPFTGPDEQKIAEANALPELLKGNDKSVQSTITLCRKWNVLKADPAEHTLLKSDLPTLVMEGQFDPITPPEYGQKVASQLSKSFYVEFAGYGHGEVIPSNPCGMNIFTSFIANPTVKPDTSCTRSLGIKFQT
jgi:pimeloyl-ACP methyl ester carboxylesterase